jgi:hypothetical protein
MKSFLCGLLLLTAVSAWVQTSATTPTDDKASSTTTAPSTGFWSRFYYGGNIGMVFTDNQTQLQISPLLGYRISDQWSVGLQLALEYYTYDYTFNGSVDVAKSTGIGGGLFTRYEAPVAFLKKLNSGVYLHGEYNNMSNSGSYKHDPSRDGQQSQHSLLLGAGFYIPVGQRTRLSLTALWSVLHSDSSPYSATPVLRLGIIF